MIMGGCEQKRQHVIVAASGDGTDSINDYNSDY